MSKKKKKIYLSPVLSFCDGEDCFEKLAGIIGQPTTKDGVRIYDDDPELQEMTNDELVAAAKATYGSWSMDFDPPLDPGIAKAVLVLREAGIETYESCEGGYNHAFKEPTIRFHGDRSEGLKAFAAALQNDLPVSALRRVWNVIDKELVGPTWEMTFWKDKR